ncbi:MAG: recombinase family protein [Bacilli bacterium]|nr:recombinase family protein [Bacilli bacterium]
MNNINIIKAIPNYSEVKKRAVGYARVSTDTLLQDTSYNLQIEELEKDIKSNSNYRFLGVFEDKASGSSIIKREEFKTMIELARQNEIDVIVTKSISRFGRNLIETITTVRELRNIGVEVIFLKENISSLDDSFDFLFSVLASHAEEESNNISDNNRWSVNKRKQKGENLTNQIYGYKIINKEFHIIEDEASVVRKIYELYLAGTSYKDIINYLSSKGIKTRKGNDIWSKATIEGILQNEKFCGDMILGKYYVKKGVKTANKRGLADMYLVENNHPAIISKETFVKAQELRKSRHKHVSKNTNKKLSQFAKFVYSTIHQSYFRYALEKPKGQSGNVTSEIPTIYCPGNGSNIKRLSFQTKVIVSLLNQVLSEVRSELLPLILDNLKLLNNKIEVTQNKESLVSRLDDLKKIKRLSEIRKLFSSNINYEINDLRKIFNKVIVNEDSINIKISISDDEGIDLNSYSLIHQTEYSFIKFYKEINYPIFIYFNGSIK